jgi:nucleotide-binding universal stress UspA family protein
MLAIQSILHPTDFSEGSAPAFRLACSLARDHGAYLIVLHVIPPPILVAGNDLVAARIIEDFHKQQSERLSRVRPVDSHLQGPRLSCLPVCGSGAPNRLRTVARESRVRQSRGAKKTIKNFAISGYGYYVVPQIRPGTANANVRNKR